MKKRVLSLFLALCLFGGNCLIAFADETEPALQESNTEEMPVEIHEQPQPAMESQNEDNARALRPVELVRCQPFDDFPL